VTATRSSSQGGPAGPLDDASSGRIVRGWTQGRGATRVEFGAIRPTPSPPRAPHPHDLRRFPPFERDLMMERQREGHRQGEAGGEAYGAAEGRRGPQLSKKGRTPTEIARNWVSAGGLSRPRCGCRMSRGAGERRGRPRSPRVTRVLRFDWNARAVAAFDRQTLPFQGD
jgi:hypothetical protein